MAERENEKEIEKEIFNLSTSESEEEEGRESDMPPPDQEPPKLPDLEVCYSPSLFKMFERSFFHWTFADKATKCVAPSSFAV